MSADEIFPIALHCNDKGWSAYAYRAHFLAAKPEGLTWYGYDTIIRSRTEVEFVAYGMRDFCDGGIGKERARFCATVPASVTSDDIDKRIVELAARRRAKELDAMESAIIEGYAAEIRANLDGVP